MHDATHTWHKFVCIVTRLDGGLTIYLSSIHYYERQQDRLYNT